MRVLTVLALTVLTCFAWAGPHLPWPESYFFPIGAWCMPTNDDGDRLDYTDGTGKTIAYWDPQDYSKMLDHKLDYGRVALRMTNSAVNPSNWPFDTDADGLPDIAEANKEAVNDLMEIGIRSFLKPYEMWFYVNGAYT